jgi:hypothetical protein
LVLGFEQTRLKADKQKSVAAHFWIKNILYPVNLRKLPVRDLKAELQFRHSAPFPTNTARVKGRGAIVGAGCFPVTRAVCSRRASVNSFKRGLGISTCKTIFGFVAYRNRTGSGLPTLLACFKGS